jgi:hypothetical protein
MGDFALAGELGTGCVELGCSEFAFKGSYVGAPVAGVNPIQVLGSNASIYLQ